MIVDATLLRRHAGRLVPVLHRHGRRVLPVLAALLVGAMAWLLLGNGPDAAKPRDGDAAGWVLPARDAIDPAATRAAWQARPPWGVEVTEEEAAAEVAARPVPVGVVVQDDGLVALFSAPGAEPQRLREGEALPGGGQVTGIARNRVSWTDADGQPQARELFAEPYTPPADGR